MGVYQALSAIGMLAGPFVSGIVVDQANIESVFVLSAVVSALGGALALVWRMPLAE